MQRRRRRASGARYRHHKKRGKVVPVVRGGDDLRIKRRSINPELSSSDESDEPGSGDISAVNLKWLSGAFDLDQRDESYLPPQESGIDAFLAGHVSGLLRIPAREGDTLNDYSIHLSEVACSGRICPEEVTQILLKYIDDSLSDLRFRTENVIASLDRACKNADRRLMKKLLVDDILYGPRYHKENAPMRVNDDASCGIGAFRHVLQDDGMDAREGFDAVLHSILGMHSVGQA